VGGPVGFFVGKAFGVGADAAGGLTRPGGLTKARRADQAGGPTKAVG
jgi:hypothetical protein